jgi:hypothetical protein
MNTIRTAVFLIALALSGGCASVVPEGLNLGCAGAEAKRINIVYKRHDSISVKPSIREVTRGEGIVFKVVGDKSRDFETRGTTGPGPFNWLDVTGTGGTERDPKYYFVCVDKDQIRGDYEYIIEIVGVGILDPAVHVK